MKKNWEDTFSSNANNLWDPWEIWIGAPQKRVESLSINFYLTRLTPEIYALAHLFPMQLFSIPGKYQKTFQFSDVFRVRESVHWEQMG